MPYPRLTKVIISYFISKNKTIFMRNKINLHKIRDDSLLDIRDSKAYKTYYDFSIGKVPPKKARKYKKVASPSKKLSPVLEKEPAEKPKIAKKHAKKSTNVPTAGVVIKDTPGVPISKKKAHSKGDRCKDMELLSDAALLGVAQEIELVPNQRFLMSHKIRQLVQMKESWGDSGDDDNDDDSNEVTKEDDDEDDVESDNDDKEEEEKEEEDVVTPNIFEFNDDEEEYDELYKDVDVKSLDADSEKERKGDAEMTNADQSASQEKSYEQVIKDAHVTLTYSRITEGSKQISSVSSYFASKFLNLDNAPLVIDEVASMMNVKTPHVESSTLAPLLLTVPVTAIPKTSIIAATTVPLII
ncbi:hypothetical protein Tco_1296288 [Tanacetum coccineum]